MTTAAPAKRCTKCHKDLTGAKRLKDAKGQYWCPDCGVGDTTTTGSGVSSLMSPCAKCKASVHATDLIRDPKTGSYICQNCSAGVKVKGGAKGAGSAVTDEAAKNKKLTIVAVIMIVIGVGAYFVMSDLL